jgi:glutaredoxin
MKYLFLPIHFIVGNLIRLVDLLTTPSSMKRSAEAQQAVDNRSKNLTLYYYPSCPFCVLVKRQMKRLNLNIRKIDPRKDTEAMKNLQEQGGKVQVPCLLISSGDGSSEWMYESADINDYLTKEFS